MSSFSGEHYSYLGPLVSSVAVDSYFAHWPEDTKKKIRGDFYNKLNDAELDYAGATKIETENRTDPVRDKLQALFMKLGSNVSNLSGHGEDDLAMIVLVSGVAIEEWTKMNLDNLVADIKKRPPPSNISLEALWG